MELGLTAFGAIIACLLCLSLLLGGIIVDIVEYLLLKLFNRERRVKKK